MYASELLTQVQLLIDVVSNFEGMLHRAVTSAGGSAHLSVALPLAPGLTWADVIAGGLERDKSLTPTDASFGGIRSDGDSAAAVVDDDHHRFSTGVGTTSFWSPGPLGGVRYAIHILMKLKLHLCTHTHTHTYKFPICIILTDAYGPYALSTMA